jgi:paraquat-inducible protein A
MSETFSAVNRKSGWVECPECGAACRDRELPPDAALRCTRCGVFVRKATGSKSLQGAWAMALAGLLLVLLANVNPILTFDVAGNKQSNHVATGVLDLFDQGYWPVAALVLFAGIAGPALHLAAVGYVASACCLNVSWPALHGVAKMAELMEQWNLVRVYAVATVVSVVKLDMLGAVEWQAGALWVLALSVCSLFAMQFFHRDLVEKRLEELA